ncbi:hypothetical protein [Tropicimonas sp. IMCC34011]|uniref:hypothetical protein n=1 Tax=Tropicimonas sp. IMCC34011 TaxID=2248759 RepID=UPI000E27E51C|nr:hypothetical protein [Tropicimonas sp. IMCC34011]
MDRSAFFAALRERDNGIFGTSLTQRQVEGTEALLDAGKGLPLHWMANINANVYRETGGGMYPVKETVFPHHKDKNPSDATVISRLDRAFAKGQLTWVRTPYWRNGAFGRGQLMITHDHNYRKFGITNYADALKLDVSARIAVEGMVEGHFTGKKLADFDFPADLDNPPKTDPRRIVNGIDGSDDLVQSYHMAFATALEVAGWGEVPPAAPAPAPEPDATIPDDIARKAAAYDRIAAITADIGKGPTP